MVCLICSEGAYDWNMSKTLGTAVEVPPYNRLGVNYHQAPPRKVSGPIIDAHMHAHNVQWTGRFLQAADDYGISAFWTMTPLEDVDALRTAFPGRFEFIAIPKWQDMNSTGEFVEDWQRRVEGFYEKGARLIKFHMAPRTQKKLGATLDHPAVRGIMRRAYELGYHFMSHVGDPKAWFGPGKAYSPQDGHRSFEEQFPMLDRMLEDFPDRVHVGAHMGGCVEDLEQLQRRLDRFPNYLLDTSATKWVVRAIAAQPSEVVRDFILRNQDRLLFGSDLVVGEKHPYDHYASRYWVHQKLWETDYRGESPIADPDTPGGAPLLTGLNLPADVLEKLYRGNAQKWLYEKVLGRCFRFPVPIPESGPAPTATMAACKAPVPELTPRA